VKRLLFVVAAAVLTLSALGVQAAGKKPVLLGEKEVTFLAERDDILVGPSKGMFSRIVFEVEENDLEMITVLVTFGSGKTEEIEVRHEFREGSRSRIIDLPGAKRVIRRITFFYKTIGPLREGRALIKVFGL
jgi:hypothetical protein